MGKTLDVILNVKARNAIRQVQRIRNNLNRLAAPLNAIGAKMASFGMYAGAAGLAAIGTGAIVAGKGVLELGIKMEQTRKSLQTMLGSVRLGNAILAKLNKFANWTPFTNDRVIAAGKTLMGFGVRAQEVSDVLKMVGDVASGSGKDFNELSMIFGKVFSKGKAQAEELNQMSEAGIPIIKTLSEMYGKTGEEIYDMASKGKIGSADVTAAFRTMTAEGGLYHDMMKKQSETAAGMWSTIVGKLQLVGAQVGESVLPAFKACLDVLGGWVDNLKADVVIEALSTIAMTGVTVVGELTKAWNTFKGFFEAIWNVLGRIGRSAMNAMLFNFLVPINHMVKAAMAGINLIIDGLNKIPKVKIDPIQGNMVTEAINIIAESAKQELVDDAKALVTGQDFSDAAEKAVRKNLEIDAKREKLHKKILGWQEKALDIQREQAAVEDAIKDEKFVPAPLAAAIEKGGKATPAALLTAGSGAGNADRLSKIGLYNAGASGANRLDGERNSLLKRVAKALDELTGSPVPVEPTAQMLT